MWERFTDGARQAVVLAEEEAVGLRHLHVGTEHLLLGVARAKHGAGPIALGEEGATVESLRAAVRAVVPPGRSAPSGHVPFTPGAKKAMELSLRECLRHGENDIDTGHVLLALLDHPGDTLHAVFAAAGVSPGAVTAAVERHLPDRPAADQPDQLARIEHLLGEVLERLDRIEGRLDRREPA